MRSPEVFLLFHLYRPRGFAGKVVEDAVYTADFVDDTAGGALEELLGERGGLRGHEVYGLDRAQHHGVVVGALVTHYAYRAHI